MKKLVLLGMVFIVVAALASPVLGAADNKRGFDHVGQFNFALAAHEATHVVQQGRAEQIALKLAKTDWKEFTPVEEQLRASSRMNKAQLIDSMAKDAKLTKSKVVRFKAGSELAKHVKSRVYESGGWMKIMKSRRFGPDNVVEEIELAIETLRLDGRITDAEAANALAALEERKVIWQHKEQNTESEADWLDK